MHRIALAMLVALAAPGIPRTGLARRTRKFEPSRDLTGVVTDTASNPLAHVACFIPELKRGGYTGPDGRYEIAGLPEGSFRIEFSSVGYRTVVRSIRAEGNPIRLDVSLVESPIPTGEIVVTAPYAADPGRTPYEVSSLPGEETRSSGAVTLSEAITRIPGVSQLTTGPGIAKPVVRGLHGSRVLTVIDGFRFDNQQWQDEHGLGLSDIGLRAAEALKGPASVLYGGDAMGGVINLVDEPPAPAGRSLADANVRIDENTLGLNANVGIRGSTEGYYWKVRAGGESHADYVDGRNERVPDTRFNDMGRNVTFSLHIPISE